MLKKLILAAGAAAAALGVCSAALAHDDDWDRGHDHRRGHERWEQHYRPYYYYQPRAFIVPAPRVVYAPPPQVAYPYYAAPVVVPPAPVYSAPGVSIRFDIPL